MLPVRTKSILSAGIAAAVMLASQAVLADTNTVYVGRTAPFTDTATIAKNIIDECNLPESQMMYLREHAKEFDVTLVEDEAALADNKGRVLIVETYSAISGGNAFTGHKKQVVVKGRLLEDGTEIGNFTGVRGSMGGMWGGYKSSCAVLHRCQSTLAKDILQWLKQPAKDSRIGE